MARGKRLSDDLSLAEEVESYLELEYSSNEQRALRELFSFYDIPSLRDWVYAQRRPFEYVNTNEMERVWFDIQVQKFVHEYQTGEHISDAEIADKYGGVGMCLVEQKNGTLALRLQSDLWYARYRQAGTTLREKIQKHYLKNKAG